MQKMARQKNRPCVWHKHSHSLIEQGKHPSTWSLSLFLASCWQLSVFFLLFYWKQPFPADYFSMQLKVFPDMGYITCMLSQKATRRKRSLFCLLGFCRLDICAPEPEIKANSEDIYDNGVPESKRQDRGRMLIVFVFKHIFHPRIMLLPFCRNYPAARRICQTSAPPNYRFSRVCLL